MLYRHDVFDSFLERSERQQHRRLFLFGGEARPMPQQLLRWVKQLSYFLMHFPDVYGGIEPLRRLEKALKRHSRSRDGLQLQAAAYPQATPLLPPEQASVGAQVPPYQSALYGGDDAGPTSLGAALFGTAPPSRPHLRTNPG